MFITCYFKCRQLNETLSPLLILLPPLKTSIHKILFPLLSNANHLSNNVRYKPTDCILI